MPDPFDPPAHRCAVKSRADSNDGDVAKHFRGVEAIQPTVERVGLAAEERVEMSIGGRGDHILAVLQAVIRINLYIK